MNEIICRNENCRYNKENECTKSLTTINETGKCMGYEKRYYEE